MCVCVRERESVLSKPLLKLHIDSFKTTVACVSVCVCSGVSVCMSVCGINKFHFAVCCSS